MLTTTLRPEKAPCATIKVNSTGLKAENAMRNRLTTILLILALVISITYSFASRQKTRALPRVSCVTLLAGSVIIDPYGRAEKLVMWAVEDAGRLTRTA